MAMLRSDDSVRRPDHFHLQEVSMKVKRVISLVVGVVSAVLISAASASAAVIDYTIAGVGTGTAFDGTNTTPFSDVPFKIDVFGNTSTLVVVPIARALSITSATITAGGITESLEIDSNPHYFFVGRGSAAGSAGFGEVVSGVSNTNFVFLSPVFASYDATSTTGPFPIFVALFDQLYIKNGPVITFSRIAKATFSAAVPEPATWAMMLIGLGGIGAVMRSRRKPLDTFATA